MLSNLYVSGGGLGIPMGRKRNIEGGPSTRTVKTRARWNEKACESMSPMFAIICQNSRKILRLLTALNSNPSDISSSRHSSLPSPIPCIEVLVPRSTCIYGELNCCLDSCQVRVPHCSFRQHLSTILRGRTSLSVILTQLKNIIGFPLLQRKGPITVYFVCSESMETHVH